MRNGEILPRCYRLCRYSQRTEKEQFLSFELREIYKWHLFADRPGRPLSISGEWKERSRRSELTVQASSCTAGSLKQRCAEMRAFRHPLRRWRLEHL